jgi:hypothetical protein
MKRDRYVRTGTPELIRDRIGRLQADIREMKAALRILEVAERDRERRQQQPTDSRESNG